MIFANTTIAIRLRTRIDLSGLQVVMKAKKPSGTVATLNATVSGSTVIYTMSDQDLDEVGQYQLWIEATGVGVSWASTVKAMTVYARGAVTL